MNPKFFSYPELITIKDGALLIALRELGRIGDGSKERTEAIVAVRAAYELTQHKGLDNAK